MTGSPRSSAELLHAARVGESAAWQELTTRFSGLLWWVTRGYRLSTEDAADVVQLCWVRLVENLERIRDPEHVDAWLVSVARRECLAVLKRTGRESLTLTDHPYEIVDPADPVETDVIRTERDETLWSALDRMPDRCRQLLRLLTGEPKLAYRDVAELLDMPIGAIGPTRQRCLTSLRSIIAAEGEDTVELLATAEPDAPGAGGTWPRGGSGREG